MTKHTSVGGFTMIHYPRGSEWRRWDLHMHSASSYDAYKGEDADDLLCSALTENNIVAAAITDHFLIDYKRIIHLRALAPNITFFPGVELRTDKGAQNLHVILIFSEKMNVKTLSENFNVIMLRQKARSYGSNDTIHWSFDDIIEFAKEHKALVSIHAGKKTNGIDKEITNATPYKEAIKEDIAREIHLFEIGKIQDIENYNKHVFKVIGEKPLILCSDNHDPRNYSTKEKLWIKADPTFEGLYQCVMQPKERVFIGNIPPKLDIVEKNKRSYIDYISVNKTIGAKNPLENWFDFEIPMNNGLIAIIGNKGSGKSALSDIIGHLCKSKSMKEASFLNPDRFRKLPKNLANDYTGTIKWLDGECEKDINLAVTEYETTIENAQYLPQRFIEKVCNDLGDEFRNEIDKVIFSYIDTTEKSDAKNLSELIENKTMAILYIIKDIQNEISSINKEIVRLEERLNSMYLKELTDNLKKKESDLVRHEKAKPKVVRSPEKRQNERYLKELNKYEKQILEMETLIEDKRIILSDINQKIDKLNFVKTEINNLIERINRINSSYKEIANEFKFDKATFLIKYSTPMSAIDNKIKDLMEERGRLQTILDNSDTADNNSLFKRTEELVNKKKALIATTDAEEKAFQKYLDDQKEWEKTRKNIIGTVQSEGSIENLKAEIDYIQKELPTLYYNKKLERLKKVKELFVQKKIISRVYIDIYRPVEKELHSLLNNLDDKIEFSVDISIVDREIGYKLLEYVNQSYRGIFNGKTEAQNKMNEFIKTANFNNSDGICDFINNVLLCIDEDMDLSLKKVKNKEEFYNLLTFLDYVGIKFSLKMGGRSLQELSPGERGMVLLVFYLALNKNDIPLIVDQPEDNLDNQSVYNKLVRCICEAKNKRQVIIVTHNPNIAVACDADQIIYCSINKLETFA